MIDETNFFCNIIRWIKEEYNNPEVFITENGWSDNGGLDDDGRIEYLHDHLEEILDVVLNDESNLKGYTGLHDFSRSRQRFCAEYFDQFLVWSIIDNFEWAQGYT